MNSINNYKITLFLSIPIESGDFIAYEAQPRMVEVTNFTAISLGKPIWTAASIIASIVRNTYCTARNKLQ